AAFNLNRIVRRECKPTNDRISDLITDLSSPHWRGLQDTVSMVDAHRRSHILATLRCRQRLDHSDSVNLSQHLHDHYPYRNRSVSME
uniref:hypothetical protein n=1 Tax=Mycobacterium sp. D16R24 TaxID=1855656 RepID=UPI001C37C2CC